MDATSTAYSGTSATSIKIISGGRAGQTASHQDLAPRPSPTINGTALPAGVPSIGRGGGLARDSVGNGRVASSGPTRSRTASRWSIDALSTGAPPG